MFGFEIIVINTQNNCSINLILCRHGQHNFFSAGFQMLGNLIAFAKYGFGPIGSGGGMPYLRPRPNSPGWRRGARRGTTGCCYSSEAICAIIPRVREQEVCGMSDQNVPHEVLVVASKLKNYNKLLLTENPFNGKIISMR